VHARAGAHDVLESEISPKLFAKVLDRSEVAERLHAANHPAGFIPEDCRRDADRLAVAMSIQDYDSLADDRNTGFQGLSEAALRLADAGAENILARTAEGPLFGNAGNLFRRPVETGDLPIVAAVKTPSVIESRMISCDPAEARSGDPSLAASPCGRFGITLL
jgi:hypothetical protein